MKAFTEDQVLDIEFRKQVLTEILASENVARKNEHLRRYEVYKDKTKKWILDSLRAEGLNDETIQQMGNRATNISICKKIVNKLARTYSGGIKRESDNDANTKAVEEMAKFLKFNNRMRKADRFRELHRNSLIEILPEQCGGTADAPEYRLGMRVLAPWHYDVIEDAFDREVARCIIKSDFFEQNLTVAAATLDQSGFNSSLRDLSFTNKKDDIIADAPSDEGEGQKRRFTWWTANYHFTTYENGALCPDAQNNESGENPIGMLPFVVNSEEQDGSFWAQGGEDITDGSILVNKMMTDMNYIAYLQGYGIPVITGKNLKERYSVGPNNAMLFDYEKDDPEPKVSFASANPPLADWREMVLQYVALLLTTNNLAPTSISGKLDAQHFASGIAKLVDASEATNDVTDKKEEYSDQERYLFRLCQAWQEMLLATNECDPVFKELPRLPVGIEQTLSVKFVETRPSLSEGEKLANLQLRKSLGINLAVDLIKMDNPDMTDQQADEKLKAILAERLANAAKFAGTGPENDLGGGAAAGGKPGQGGSGQQANIEAQQQQIQNLNAG